METRTFDKTRMEITPIGFGSWAIGGSGWAAAPRPRDDEKPYGGPACRERLLVV